MSAPSAAAAAMLLQQQQPGSQEQQSQPAQQLQTAGLAVPGGGGGVTALQALPGGSAGHAVGLVAARPGVIPPLPLSTPAPVLHPQTLSNLSHLLPPGPAILKKD